VAVGAVVVRKVEPPPIGGRIRLACCVAATPDTVGHDGPSRGVDEARSVMARCRRMGAGRWRSGVGVTVHQITEQLDEKPSHRASRYRSTSLRLAIQFITLKKSGGPHSGRAVSNC
jgi:hypothetical protein